MLSSDHEASAAVASISKDLPPQVFIRGGGEVTTRDSILLALAFSL
jgi:hypothetical protein